MEDARAHILYGAPRPASGAGMQARGTWGNRSGGDLAALDTNPGANPGGGASGAAPGGAAGEAHLRAKPGSREEGEAAAAANPNLNPDLLRRQPTADAAEFLTAKSAFTLRALS